MSRHSPSVRVHAHACEFLATERILAHSQTVLREIGPFAR